MMTMLRVCAVLVGAQAIACSSDDFLTTTGTDASPPDASSGDSAVPVDGGGGSDAAGCAIDCQGGECVGGVCQPVVLAKGLNGPYGIALAGGNVYVTEYVAHGRVLQLNKGGANQTPVVLASEPALAALVKFPGYVTQPFFIAASATDVFWSDVGGLGGSGFTKLFRVGTAPNAPITPYYEICAQGEVGVTALKVFWTNQTTPQCLQPGQNGIFRGDLPNGGHSGSVYFPGGLDGGAMVTPNAVGVDAQRVFVGAGNQLLIFDASKINDPQGVNNALLGGTNTLSAPPYGIANDVDTVFWTDHQAMGKISALSKNAMPNTPPIVLANKQGNTLGITADDPGLYVYYTNYGDGQLMRVKKSGLGQPEVVLSNLVHPAFLMSDANNLFFTVFGTGQGDGMVMRLAR